MHCLLRSQHLAERSVRVWLEAAPSFVNFGRHVAGRDYTQRASFVQKQHTELGLAEPHGVRPSREDDPAARFSRITKNCDLEYFW
jgi:hypothetical protein